MPTFLSDPPFAVYLVLAAGCLVAFAVWFANRTRRSVAALGVVGALLAVVFLIDTLFESTREEAVRRAQAMVEAATACDTEAFVSHVADRFEYQGEGAPIAVTRDQLRKARFWDVLQQNNVRVAAWDFARADVEHINDDTVEIGFLAKGEGQGQQVPIYLRARFARQADGQMKLVAVASFDPLKRVNERKTIPYFP